MAGIDDILLRAVTRTDLPAVADIYNHYVLTSTCTFATEPEAPPYWDAWFEEHTDRYPAIVAVRADRIVGWGSLSRWNTRCAYRFTAEDSVYVEHSLHGQGIGRLLLERLIRLARELGLRSILAQIADGQPASDILHKRLGFRHVGHLKRVGFKFDRWIDVSLWQRDLHPPDVTSP